MFCVITQIFHLELGVQDRFLWTADAIFAAHERRLQMPDMMLTVSERKCMNFWHVGYFLLFSILTFLFDCSVHRLKSKNIVPNSQHRVTCLASNTNVWSKTITIHECATRGTLLGLLFFVRNDFDSTHERFPNERHSMLCPANSRYLGGRKRQILHPWHVHYLIACRCSCLCFLHANCVQTHINTLIQNFSNSRLLSQASSTSDGL